MFNTSNGSFDGYSRGIIVIGLGRGSRRLGTTAATITSNRASGLSRGIIIVDAGRGSRYFSITTAALASDRASRLSRGVIIIGIDRGDRYLGATAAILASDRAVIAVFIIVMSYLRHLIDIILISVDKILVIFNGLCLSLILAYLASINASDGIYTYNEILSGLDI